MLVADEEKATGAIVDNTSVTPPKKTGDAHGTHLHLSTKHKKTHREIGKTETLATVKKTNELSPPKKYK